MKVTQLHEQNPKQFLNPTPTPKLAQQGQKNQKLPKKVSQIQMSELKEITKMRVVQLHE